MERTGQSKRLWKAMYILNFVVIWIWRGREIMPAWVLVPYTEIDNSEEDIREVVQASQTCYI